MTVGSTRSHLMCHIPSPTYSHQERKALRRPDVSLGVLGASQTLQVARLLAMLFSKMANNSWWSVSQNHIESSFNIQGSGIHRKFRVACMHDNHILCFFHCEIFIVRRGTGKQIYHSINVWWAMWKFHKLFPSTVGHVGTQPLLKVTGTCQSLRNSGTHPHPLEEPHLSPMRLWLRGVRWWTQSHTTSQQGAQGLLSSLFCNILVGASRLQKQEVQRYNEPPPNQKNHEVALFTWVLVSPWLGILWHQLSQQVESDPWHTLVNRPWQPSDSENSVNEATSWFF